MQKSSCGSLVRWIAGTALFGAIGCGGKAPPAQLPSTGAYSRAASRIDLVELAISDAARAAKVRALYVEIEKTMLEMKKVQAVELLRLGLARERTDTQTRVAVRAVQQAELAALERYVTLQMAIRRSTSADEFARLDAIK